MTYVEKGEQERKPRKCSMGNGRPTRMQATRLTEEFKNDYSVSASTPGSASFDSMSLRQRLSYSIAIHSAPSAHAAARGCLLYCFLRAP